MKLHDIPSTPHHGRSPHHGRYSTLWLDWDTVTQLEVRGVRNIADPDSPTTEYEFTETNAEMWSVYAHQSPQGDFKSCDVIGDYTTYADALADAHALADEHDLNVLDFWGYEPP